MATTRQVKALGVGLQVLIPTTLIVGGLILAGKPENPSTPAHELTSKKAGTIMFIAGVVILAFTFKPTV